MTRRRTTHTPIPHDDSLGMIFAACLTLLAAAIAAMFWVGLS